MRDHTKLRAIELADELVLLVYRFTTQFPTSEQFELTSPVSPQRPYQFHPTLLKDVPGTPKATTSDFLTSLMVLREKSNTRSPSPTA